MKHERPPPAAAGQQAQSSATWARADLVDHLATLVVRQHRRWRAQPPSATGQAAQPALPRTPTPEE